MLLMFFFHGSNVIDLGFVMEWVCRNPSLGLMTKARVCKGAGQKGSSGITFHAHANVGECEGMNLHTPK
jgi:hypothetical protein